MTLYDDLGVSPDASKKDIEKAYRAKAMKQHPDQGGDKEKFQALTIAYSVLKDPERRARYDRTGETNTPRSRQDTLFRMLLVEGFTRSDHPISMILKKIDSDRKDGEKARDQLNGKKATLQRRLDKFLKLNNNDLVKETIEGAIAHLDHEIQNLTEQLDMLTRLANDFKEFKEEQEQQFNYGSAKVDKEQFMRMYLDSFGGTT